jgi:peptidoglycan biosynthesis protein MviN/MurJ (putative lipid II flippase)
VNEHVEIAAKATIDVLSLGVLIGAIVQWLPALASVLTIIWTAIRIYETKTVQRWLGRDTDET